jgi:hypothetical protein
MDQKSIPPNARHGYPISAVFEQISRKTPMNLSHGMKSPQTTVRCGLMLSALSVLSLALRRAQSATDYLVARGASRAGLIVSGRGLAEPIADNATDEGRALNRRVTLTRLNCARTT